jgi:N-acetylglutamate synthase-like GNAT family acetyltransferase
MREAQMTHDLEIRAGSGAEFDAAIELLSREHFGPIGLLRSLVVAPAFRAAGLGRVLVTALESQAASLGVRELWLLTIDADAWFEKLGYEARQRGQAPEVITRTAEFASLCPGDAVLMQKTL